MRIKNKAILVFALLSLFILPVFGGFVSSSKANGFPITAPVTPPTQTATPRPITAPITPPTVSPKPTSKPNLPKIECENRKFKIFNRTYVIKICYLVRG